MDSTDMEATLAMVLLTASAGIICIYLGCKSYNRRFHNMSLPQQRQSSTNYRVQIDEELQSPESLQYPYLLYMRRFGWFKQIFFIVAIGTNVTYLVINNLNSMDYTINNLVTIFVILMLIFLTLISEPRANEPEVSANIRPKWSTEHYVSVGAHVIVSLIITLQAAQLADTNLDKNNDISLKLLLLAAAFTFLASIFHVISLSTAPKGQRKEPTTEFIEGLYSYLSFSYINGLMRLGEVKEALEVEDVPTMVDGDTCASIYEKMRVSADSTSANSNKAIYAEHSDGIAYNKLGIRLFETVREDFLVQAMYQFFSSTIGYLPPLAIQCILQYIATASLTKNSSTTPTTNSSLVFSRTALFTSQWLDCQSPFVSISSQNSFRQPFTTQGISTSNYFSLAASNSSSATAGTYADDITAQSAHSSILTAWLSINMAVALLFIAPFVQSICFGQNYHLARRNAGRIRAGLIAVLYKKSMYVDLTYLVEGIGTVNNLIAVDVKEISELVSYFHFLWASLLEVSICLTLLYLVIGISALGGILVMCLAVPLGGIGSKYLDQFQNEMLKIKDERMNVIGEVLSGIRIIKWFVWEDNFRLKVDEVRKRELQSLRSYVVCDALLRINWNLLPILVGLVTFLVHTQLLHKTLYASQGFTALLLFNLLRRPMNIFPDIVSMLIRARVSFQRVKKFLDMPTVAGLEGLKPLPSHVVQVQDRFRDAGSIQSSPERISPIRLKHTLTNSSSSVVRQPNMLAFRDVTIAWNHATEKIEDSAKPGSRMSLTKYSTKIWQKSTLSLQQSIRQIYSSNQDLPTVTSDIKLRTPRKQRSIKDDIMEDATSGNIPLNKPSQTLFRAVDSIWKVATSKPSSSDENKHDKKKGSKTDSHGYSKLDSTPSHDSNDDGDDDEEVKYDGSIELASTVRNPLFGTPPRKKQSDNFSIYDENDAEAEGEDDETRDEKDKMTNTIVLRDLTFSVPKNSLTVIIGSTGSGKSSLFSGLLGECKILNGQIELVPGSEISLATQSAWIQNASLRDNILFGAEYDPLRYRRVLFACALEADLAQFPDKDLTDIGEKGVNLSGGQQQRVSLARAAYSKSDIILLDDPLSAVDAHVGDHIFKHLICGFLRNRTRVLVTHQVALVLPLADHIICLDGQGSIAASGTPAQISTQLNNYMVRNTSSTSLATLAARAGNMSNNDLRRSSNSSIGTALTDVDDDAVTDADDSPPPLKPGLQTSKQNITDSSNQAPSQIKATKHRFFELIVSLNLNSASTKIDADCDSKADDSYEIDSMLAAPETIIVSETALSRRVMSMLVDKESKSTGGVGLSVYWFYLHATGGVLAGCTLILANLSVSVSWFYNSYTLGEWMQSIQQKDSARQQQFQLSEYIVSVCICLFVVTFLRMFQAFSALKASRDIHDKLLDNILTATLSWHDSQPSGRKVNRFSQDIATLDSTVMNNLQDFLDCFMSTIQVVIVISVLVPIMIPFLLPVVLYNYIVSKKYIKVSRELKRLESVSKSPIFVLFSETLTGLPVVRAFRHEKRFFNLACEYVDVMNRCHLYMWISNRWLNFRTQCMGACVSGCVAWFVVHQADNIGSTVAGLVLLNAMNFTDAITYMTRMHGECQMSMNSVERIAEYCDVEKELYEPEPTLNSNSINRALKKNHKTSKSKNGYATIHATDDDEETGVRSLVTEDSLTDSTELEMVDISAAWPEQGSITFDNIQLSYKPNDPPVLKGVSFEIPSGSKVGVVGRSGAGKSSLIAALFRTVEPTGGALRISNSNVLRMPLKTIRKCLAIVPQEPVLFRGTMKSNMDPFLERTDEDIWLALKKVHMDEHVANMPGSCGSPSGPLDGIIVAERGNNFSLGQRQLLCMARALLRKSKILILDEATASVDAETDSLIQETVRRELHDMTVLSIAHRLHTIAFYDKVIVMDRGSVAEFDTPYNLLNKKDSIFYSMCERSGDLEVIYKIAKAKYMEKGI